ncbi:hypothetical protein CYMTET_54582 [Cymbomonas tetramitiformis]|uniref:Uncharacterized protein n=1 Tax=Cymbomonas tetramitiformis TaxID=36881 RepID=A0AAE0BFW3_9CHLO|nr:hypothetical protein CYMTET_54582 [Cymbomonas tetramitiformis]
MFSLSLTVAASERVTGSDTIIMNSVVLLTWALLSLIRKDYSPEAGFRDMDWTSGPYIAGVAGGAVTWLWWAPISTVTWYALAQSFGIEIGDAQFPAPEGWAPPFVEIVEASLIILPCFRGVARYFFI